MHETTSVLSFERSVPAPAEAVYYAFSTGQGWRDWLCDSAVFKSLPGGSYHLSWDTGWYASGRIEELNKPSRVRLSWRGAEDPAATQVTIDLHGRDDHTHVSVEHSGFGSGEGWEAARQEAARGWETGLENLESIFTTGADLRITRRPMMGIMINDFSPEIAAELGVPVGEGVRVDRPIDGMGAERAGIQPSDVIVEMDGKPVRGFADLGAVLQPHSAGDTIPVTVYRGSETVSVEMELSRRPIPELPLDPAELVKRVRPIYEELNQELVELFAGVSEAEASFRPGPEEWSAQETLAHLIEGEGFNVALLSEQIQDGQREFNDQGINLHETLVALIDVYPTIPELLGELKRRQEETLHLLARAERLKARKGVMWRTARGWLEIPLAHERGHMEQMRAAIQAARAAEPARVAT